jgi:hypothetical protein
LAAGKHIDLVPKIHHYFHDSLVGLEKMAKVVDIGAQASEVDYNQTYLPMGVADCLV